MWNDDVPEVQLSWHNGSLHLAYSTGGLHAIHADGSRTTLSDSLKIGTITPLPGGDLAALLLQNRQIARLDLKGQRVATLVDSSDSIGTPKYLAADIGGGLYFTAQIEEGDNTGKVFYRNPEGAILVAFEDGEVAHPGGLALKADGSVLFLNAAESAHIWALDIGADGSLSNRRPFAELFVEDGRYGKPRTQPVDVQAEGMTADRKGRLYVATRSGIQIFSPGGDLLGTATFPDLPLSWNPKRPLGCLFGGPDLSTLYVSCGDEVFAISTLTRGF